MKKYIHYLKYMHQHRKEVMRLAIKKRCFPFIFHDLDKYLPDEIVPFARCSLNYVNNDKDMNDLDKAIAKHIKRSKHHWEHYVLPASKFNPGTKKKFELYGTNIIFDMPRRYIIEMICDWEAFQSLSGSTAQAYYLCHYHDITVTHDTRVAVEGILGFLTLYDMGPISESSPEYWMTLEELANSSEEQQFRKDMHKIETTYGIQNLYKMVQRR